VIPKVAVVVPLLTLFLTLALSEGDFSIQLIHEADLTGTPAIVYSRH
jgi:hypothetical protein